MRIHKALCTKTEHRLLHIYDPQKWQVYRPQYKRSVTEVTYAEKSILFGLIKWYDKIGEQIIEEGKWEDEPRQD